MATKVDWSKLLRAAEEVMANAYAPYSGFRVGAAVLTTDGGVFVGCNVENASYGLTVCAERSALFAAVAGTPGHKVEVAAIAITTDPVRPGSPCGACRQVLSEFGSNALVSYVSKDGRIEVRVEDLLPDAFVIE